MIYDYVVVGGGPSGIVVAHRMSKSGKTVLLLEHSQRLGGCWKVAADLSEHSPKVIDSHSYRNFRDFMKEVGAPFDTQPVYHGNGMFKLMVYLFRRLSRKDVARLGIALGSTILGVRTYRYYASVQEWMIEQRLTTEGRRAIRTLCIALANVPEKMCIGVLFDALSANLFVNFVRLVRPNEWIRVAERRLVAQGCVLRFNTSVRSVRTVDPNAPQGGVSQVTDSQGRAYKARTIVLCVPITQLLEIVRRSDDRMRRNWFPTVDKFEAFVERSSYIGLGFLVRFGERLDTAHTEWCWSCGGDWTIIVIDKTSKKAPTSVWSCAIVDMDTPSAHLGKTPRRCTMDELRDELLRQLDAGYGGGVRRKVVSVTPHAAIAKDALRGWDTIHAGFSNRHGTLTQRGRAVPNVFTVGPHTMPGIATLETAVESALLFCRAPRRHTRVSRVVLLALVAVLLSPVVLCAFLVVGFAHVGLL